MKILITGGAGFMGSHLCEKYTKAGHIVLCLDNFVTGNLTNIRHLLNYRNFKLISGDIRNFDLLEKIMRDVEVVFHLAAQIHVDKSVIEPQLTYEINVLGTQNILEVARVYDVEKVIYMSSSEVYGSAVYAPMDENHPLDSPHPYGASKIAADRMCYAYAQSYHMNIVIVRPFNTFGPRQKDSGYGGAISIFVRRALNGIPPIIYGDGNQMRDYVYIEDLVNGLDLIMNYSGPIGEPINLGTGSEIKIIDLANKIIELCGQTDNIQPVHVGPRPGEVNRLIGQSLRAREILGWEPQFTLEQGLGKFINWYKNYEFEEWSKPR